MPPRNSRRWYFPNVEKTKYITDRDWRWPNFEISEFACRHCGEGYFWPEFFDRIQAVRSDIGKPIRILSGHRCSLHNARVGGAPFSQHLTMAADVSALNHERGELLRACQRAGFKGFGFYHTFLHIDLGPPRHWWSDQKARELWKI